MSYLVWIGAAVLAAVLYASDRWQRKVHAAWSAAARKLGLGYDHFGGRRSMQGPLGDGVYAHVHTEVRGSGKNRTTWTILVVDGARMARGVSVRGEGALAKVKKLLGAQDVTVGDPEFDRRVHLQGDEATVLAALGHEVRAPLAQLVASTGVIDPEGSVRLEMSGVISNADRLVALVQSMTRLAQLMEGGPHDVAARLARHATTDPVPAVRRRNFDALLQWHTTSDEARRTAEALLDDADPDLRIAAARWLRDRRSFAVLRGIVEGPGQPEAREAALQALLGGWQYPLVAPLLEVALRTGRPPLRQLALKAIGEARDTSLLDAVLAVETHGDDALSEALADTLEALQQAAAEPVLVGLLAHESAGVRAAAARALGALGTIASVEPLLPLTEGLATPRAVKEAARDAVRRIQGRLGPAEGGRLSLVAEAEGAGALSLASESGELSLAPDEATADAPGVASRGRERA